MKLTLAIVTLLLLASAHHAAAAPAAVPHVLVQSSTIEALAAGNFEGVLPLATLKGYGDFGLGSVGDLDGEITMLDGVCYHTDADGKVTIAENTLKMAFAEATFLQPATAVAIPAPLDHAAVLAWLDRTLPSPNYFYAIRIEGEFTDLVLWSGRKLQQTHADIASVLSGEKTTNVPRQRGTIIGFYAPSYAKGINLPGYHFHFLSEDKQLGGHLRDFHVANAAACLEMIPTLSLWLPTTERFGQSDLTTNQTDRMIEEGKKPAR